jgi:uncharacterized protein YerC
MSRVSKRIINKDINVELGENFSFLISSLQNPKEIEQFFADFLTQEENLMLAKRLMLHLLLENGYKTNEIASTLSLSQETVRVHNLSRGKEGEVYKKIIAKLSSRRKIKLFLQMIKKKLRPLDLALKSKTDMKARSKLISGDY